MHCLAGKPMLEHVIDAARALKPVRICVVYGHGGEQVPSALPATDITYVLQKQQLGTGHAVKQAIPHLDPRSDTLVLYGDVPLIGTSTLRKLTRGRGEQLRLLTATFENPYGYGRILRDDKGNVTGIIEEKDATPNQRLIKEGNTGLLVIPTKRMKNWFARLSNKNAQKEYYLTDIVSMAVEDRVPIDTVAPEALWEIHGVNNQNQLAGLERIYQLERANLLMEKGVCIADPKRFDLRGTLQCGTDVQIDVNCVFEGKVAIGSRVSIGANCVIRNTTIGAGTEIAPFSMLDNAHVGADCRVGPYARIRPATELSDNVHIGNFVEIKASRIGKNSKANHLTYIGDSSVGQNVNIGAGTITCNYDGANKHKTVIEDNAFIGSATQLVAPVTVGRSATIGAGSTITKDAPANQLTLSRAQTLSIRTWKRPPKAAKDV